MQPVLWFYNTNLRNKDSISVLLELMCMSILLAGTFASLFDIMAFYSAELPKLYFPPPGLLGL